MTKLEEHQAKIDKARELLNTAVAKANEHGRDVADREHVLYCASQDALAVLL